jgi:hypothetical protein
LEETDDIDEEDDEEDDAEEKEGIEEVWWVAIVLEIAVELLRLGEGKSRGL